MEDIDLAPETFELEPVPHDRGMQIAEPSLVLLELISLDENGEQSEDGYCNERTEWP